MLLAETAEVLDTGVTDDPKDLEDTADPDDSLSVTPKKKTPRKRAKKRVEIAVKVEQCVKVDEDQLPGALDLGPIGLPVDGEDGV